MMRCGSAISPRAIASICCSPPLIEPATGCAAREAREMARPLDQRRRLVARLDVRAELQVLDTVICGKTAALRNQRDAAAHDSWMGEPESASPRSGCALLRAEHAGDHPHRGRLARPVGAEQGDDLPGLDPDRDVADGQSAAVRIGEAGHLQHRLASRRGRPPPPDHWRAFAQVAVGSASRPGALAGGLHALRTVVGGNLGRVLGATVARDLQPDPQRMSRRRPWAAVYRGQPSQFPGIPRPPPRPEPQALRTVR